MLFLINIRKLITKFSEIFIFKVVVLLETVRGRGLVTRNGTFLFPKDTELTNDELNGFIKWNSDNLQPKYRENMKLYLSEHDILYDDPKEFGPDNRLVANLAKYIIDTYNGYSFGVAPKIILDKGDNNDSLQDWLSHVSFFDKLNELGKQTSIYGRSIGYVYQNENAETEFTYVSPSKAFIIYDNTVNREPLAFVMYEYYKNESEWQARGKIYYATKVYDFDNLKLSDEYTINPYKIVPAVEFYENEERQGVLDPVKTLLNAYDKVLSQKANQNEYFDNAYLAAIGIKFPINPKTKKPDIDIANNRFLYLPDVTQGTNPKLEFISKPDNDSMQENYLKRLEDLIYQVSMVPNLNDQAFAGNQSGVALQYKLLSLQNKTANQVRKFKKSLRQLFRVIFSVGQVVNNPDLWDQLSIEFHPNLPADIAGAISDAKNVEGLVSQRTALKLLPFVSDPDEEIKQINQEKQENIKNAQQAAGSLPDYLNDGEDDDDKSETE